MQKRKLKLPWPRRPTRLTFSDKLVSVTDKSAATSSRKCSMKEPPG
jgi:hypothetical protein